MTSAPAPSDMLSEMTACAHRLGMAFGREAEREADWKRKLELFNLFDRCFFSVRVAIALQLRQRREGTMRYDVARAEGLEIERPEPLETEAPERAETLTCDERDRDRETERASLPLLLATLSGVAQDAAALPGPAPAELPTLRELLARVGAEPAPPRRPGPKTNPETNPVPLRARLAGSAGLALAIPPLPASPARPLRRATGPPPRRR